MFSHFNPIELHGNDGHRQATWLELFFDLAFVISIAALSLMLAENHSLEGLVLYVSLFLAVYWAWNQLTWYSSLFDNNDVFYRVMYLGSILGVLVLAASIRKITHGETTLFVISYIIIQGLLVVGWLRIFISKTELRSFSLKYILGQIFGSIVWLVSLLFPPPEQYYVWIVAMLIHIAAPYFAWKTKIHIPIHTSHIVERYSLLTIIVLGETLVAVSIGMGYSPDSNAFLISILGYIIIACIWWTYFNWDFSKLRNFETTTNVFIFGYGHFIVFVAIAAFGAGIEIAIHSVEHSDHLTLAGQLLIAAPPSIYLLSLLLINRFTWDMAFDKQMVARSIVAFLSIFYALLTIHAHPVLFVAGIALLMVCLVCYEEIYCGTA
ncbi:low temperature requirement protein A [Candidatus Colwellia aromaticivorans]|uniref:low temperature requirement protein A n=1 Tax=Candidatus Colwellia aromaticivorans TaxID=2267621 RepID=UPI00144390AA|nr:low temperature requirement protein A [Candidatus Colwellia aromaticivorans]